MWTRLRPRGAVHVRVMARLEADRITGVEGGPGSAAGRQVAGQPEAEEKCQLREVLGGVGGGPHSVPSGDGWRHCSSRSWNDGDWEHSGLGASQPRGPDGCPRWRSHVTEDEASPPRSVLRVGSVCPSPLPAEPQLGEDPKNLVPTSYMVLC